MDLNELLHAHQVEVMKATMNGNQGARQDHYDQVALYAEKIRELRQLLPRSPDAGSPARPDTVIYGTYAGDNAHVRRAGDKEDWETEGGSLDPPQVPLPHGITSKVVRHFSVGPYVYTDLGLAIAENSRQKP